jgi:Tfp pilus assembly protein PilN
MTAHDVSMAKFWAVIDRPYRKMKILAQTDVGIEIAGQDLRVAAVRDFAGKRRLVRVDVLTGFLGFTEEDRVLYLVAHFKKHKLSSFNVHLALPGTWGITRDLEFPATVGEADTLRSAVALQLENLSPWPLEEIYWDCTWEPAAKGAASVVVHTGIVPRAVLDPWIALFRSARLALTGASLSSLSWAHGVTVLWGKERPTMIVAAEDGYVEGALIREGRIYGIHMPGPDVANLVPASASQLMRAGRIDSLDHVRVVTHGAANADAERSPVELPIEASSDAANSFGAICAALLGLVGSAYRSNLIPPQMRYQRNRLQLVPTYFLVAAVVVLGVFVWIREPYQQLAYADQLQARVQGLAPAMRSVADEERQLNRLIDRLRALDAVLHSRDSNLEALRELTRILPPGTWLGSYQYQDRTVSISGVSDSAASVQKIIEDSPIFRDAQFTSSITRDGYGKDRFTIRATVEAQQ